jgi:transcriptional regulator with PAS, ATPase and Fis domain
MSHLIRNAVEQRRLYYENRQLRSHIEELNLTDDIIGDSEPLKAVLDKVSTVAPTDSTVMIRGESGTGKELIARAIHANSTRRYFPIITINCGAYTEGLLESELFGHEKGAFTGALYQRRGKLEMADKGTIFLDEIGNISMKMQMDLLRVIETRQFSRLGGDKTISVDFRIICATNKDLEAAVRNGTFRDDLYYRLNVFSIELPPLRERPDDIARLARFFVNKYAQAMNKGAMDISPETIALLGRYNWPGNVRELRNAIERAVVSTRGTTITPNDLSFPLPEPPGDILEETGSLQDIERNHIKKILRKTGGNITKAAGILKISRLTLYKKIDKYRLKK